jgi:hypothetical protein
MVTSDENYYCSEVITEAYCASIDINTPEELLKMFPLSYYGQLS